MQNENTNIPIAKTFLTKNEINSVVKPLNSGWLVQGQYVHEFENKFSKYTESKYSIAVTSCTSALHLLLQLWVLKLMMKQLYLHSRGFLLQMQLNI